MLWLLKSILPFLSVSLALADNSVVGLGRSESVIYKDFELTKKASRFTFQLELDYAQSLDTWKVVSDVRRAQGSLPAINKVLKNNYGVPEEAFTKVSLSFSLPIKTVFPGYMYFNSTAEGLAYGLVQNPVVPELHADAIAVGVFGGGFGAKIESANLDIKLGGVAGFGREKRIDATSTDLIDAIPLRVGAVNLYGLDLYLRHRYDLSSVFDLNTEASLKETLFETTTPQGSLSSNESQSLLTHRWKAKSGLEGRTEIPFFQKSSLSIEGIAGPQPLPTDPLPRVWDYAHRLYPTPELGAMFGAGLYFKGAITRRLSLQSHAGLYAGYIGGDIGVNWGVLSLTAASWGIETSSAYRVLGGRIWQASLGLSF